MCNADVVVFLDQYNSSIYILNKHWFALLGTLTSRDVESTESCVKSTESHVESTESHVENTESHVESTKNYVESTDESSDQLEPRNKNQN